MITEVEYIARALTNLCVFLFAVIPLLLLFCQCGGANYIFPEQFTDLPFDAKEHLISYHTEGKGDDKVRLCVTVKEYYKYIQYISIHTRKPVVTWLLS